MAKQVRTSATKITTNYFTPDDQVVDLGAFRVVCIQCRRLKTQASATTVVVWHNTTKDADGWMPSAVAFKLDGTDPDFAELASFSRYLRLQAPQAADGSAVFQVDWIGKE